jgi:hypothetical protein
MRIGDSRCPDVVDLAISSLPRGASEEEKGIETTYLGWRPLWRFGVISNSVGIWTVRQ